jgi:Secretion system C-terminal sorting domain
VKKITLLMLIVFTITVQGQNKLLSSINESYYNNTWNNSSGFNYEYDSNNNLTAETYLDWDNLNNDWKIIDKTTYIYNASNKVTQEIYQSSWNSPNNTIENSEKTTYTYTAGMLTEGEGYEWENSNWVLFYKFVITYNANNLPYTILYYTRDDTQWVNDERTTFTYNANNKLIADTDEVWDGSQWVNSFKSLYTYNANNKIIADRVAEWDDFNAIWVEKYRTDYELDATGNRISITDNQGSSRYKNEYTYDTFNLMSGFGHPFKDKTGVDYLAEDFPYVNKVQIENRYSFNAQTNNFYLSGRTTYNYNTAITLSTETIEKPSSTIAVYPNPTKDALFIQNETSVAIDKVIVTDMTGKKVLEQNNASQVNVANLVKGLYVVEAFSGEEKFTSKFIKE